MRPKPSLSPALLGSLAALGATLIWSGNFVVSRSMFEAMPPATLAFCRWSVAFVVLLPLALPALIRNRAAIRAHLPYILVTSFLGVTVFNTLIYMAGSHTTAVNMALICSFVPAFILLLSRIFLGEPLTLPRLSGLVVAVSGVVLLITRGNLKILLELSLNFGDLIMLLAALLFATYSILVRKKPADIGTTALLGASFGLGLLMLIPWMLVEQAAGTSIHLSSALIGSILYIGLGASLTSYWLWSIALERIGPSRAGFIYYTLPLFSGLEATAILGEPITWLHALSATLIISGIFLATRTRA